MRLWCKSRKMLMECWGQATFVIKSSVELSSDGKWWVGERLSSECRVPSNIFLSSKVYWEMWLIFLTGNSFPHMAAVRISDLWRDRQSFLCFSANFGQSGLISLILGEVVGFLMVKQVAKLCCLKSFFVQLLMRSVPRESHLMWKKWIWKRLRVSQFVL